jgi:D-proline reductase (dithiol) PrdB
VRVDSFAFLPRSFRGLYETATPAPGDDEPVWAPFEPRLAAARIALLSSAGLHVAGAQEPFDGERERREPTWGDPTWRAIPGDAPQGGLGMMHLHVNNEDVLADHEVALPLRALRALAEEGVVGNATATHLSVMGFQEAGLRGWREETAPAIVDVLRAEEADGLILAPV